MKRKIKNVGRDKLRMFSRRRYGSNYSFISSVGFKQKFSDYALSFYVRNVVAVNYNRFSYVLFFDANFYSSRTLCWVDDYFIFGILGYRNCLYFEAKSLTERKPILTFVYRWSKENLITSFSAFLRCSENK